MLVAETRTHAERAQRRRRREIICLLLVLISLVICLSSFTIMNGDVDVGLNIDLSAITGDLKDTLARRRGKNYDSNYLSEYDSYEVTGDLHLDAKLILLWTSWYKDPEWKKVFAKNGGPWVSFNERDDESGIVQRRYCYLTTNHSLVNNADALIFHSTDFRLNYSKSDLPSIRYPWQKYIFFSLEPPQLNRLNDKDYRENVNALQFNTTMSYSRFSDVVFPYGRVFDFNNETQSNPNFIENVRLRITDFVASFSRRPKDAVWIVSDCTTMGRRENIVRTLALHGIKVDIWGKCWGSKQPDRLWQRFGIRTFFQQYRFYLAFENSLCEEYITEKAYQGLAASANFGLIPIVYGLANYPQFLPEGSYIDATVFPNASLLARLMREISSPDYSWERLTAFYSWQYRQYVPSDHNNWRVVNGWRNLCRHLHAKDPPKPQFQSALVDQEEKMANFTSNCKISVISSSSNLTNETTVSQPSQQKVIDIRTKIGACVWTSDFDPEKESYDLQF